MSRKKNRNNRNHDNNNSSVVVKDQVQAEAAKKERSNVSRPSGKLDAKDIVIVALSVIALCMLGFIIYVSNKQDREIATFLENNQEMTTDDVVASLSGETQFFVEITEVCGDKWIEIHSLSTDPMDISGLQVMLGGENVATVEDGKELKKDEYLAIDLSKNPGETDSNVLSIVDKDGVYLKSILVPKLASAQSYGIADKETNVWGYMEPTKSAQNKTEAQYAQYDGLQLSAPGGFYDGGFNLEIKAGEGETVYYTTDGTDPTTESTRYEEPVKITNQSGSNYVYARLAMTYREGTNFYPSSVDRGTVVRAIAVNSKGEVTKETCQSYYIGITRDSDYLNIPVLSITTDPDNLFDYEKGIYVSGKAREDALIQGFKGSNHANYFNNWSRPAKIEYFESTKNKSFEADADIRVLVNFQTTNKQKEFSLTLGDDEYQNYKGASILDYVSSKKTITLVQGGDDNKMKVRNYLVQTMTEDMSVDCVGYKPCVLFIDGEYWGLYSLKADLDDAYVSRTYGVSKDEVLIHRPDEYNEQYNFMYMQVTERDLSEQGNYDYIRSMLDIDNYIDYICANMFFANSSFSPNRGQAWRTKTKDGEGYYDGKWRFVIGDMSKTMENSNLQTKTINSYLQVGMQSDLMLQSLLMNKDFCTKLTQRMDQLLAENFSEESCTEAVSKVSGTLKKPTCASYIRFFGKLTDKEYGNNISIIKEFLLGRGEYIGAYTKELANKGGDLAKARELIQQATEDNTEENTEENATNSEEQQGEEAAEGTAAAEENPGAEGESEQTNDNTNG